MHTLRYGNAQIPVPLPEGQIVQELLSNPVELPRRTPAERVRYALDHPIGADPLEEVVAPGDTVCIVISDITRQWQSPADYLQVLVERLNRAGVPDKNILILSATGIHRTQTCREWTALLGEELCRRLDHTDHACDDKATLT